MGESGGYLPHHFAAQMQSSKWCPIGFLCVVVVFFHVHLPLAAITIVRLMQQYVKHIIPADILLIASSDVLYVKP